MSMKFKSIEIKGKTFDIDIENDGRFSTALDGGDYAYAKSIDELKTKIAAMMSRKSVKLAIEFVRWDDGRLKRGMVTGIHASNRNLLVKWDGVKGVDQQATYYALDYIPVELADEYAGLCEKAKAAETAKEKFIEAHSMDVKEIVSKELDKKGDGVGSEVEI